MSGHSKWHNIRLRKGAQDAKRSNLFTKLAKEIMMAARSGGGSPDTNLRLRLAIQKAREQSMPQDNIARAVKKGTGELEGETFEEVVYEGYGPGGVAFILECATDNKNRTVSNLRSILNKHGGRLAETGSVSYRFRPIGRILIAHTATDEETLFNVAIEAGAEDVKSDEEQFEVVAQPEDFASVRQAIEAANIAIASAEYTMEPADTIELESEDAVKMLRLLDKLEDDDDIQNIHVNFVISEEALEAASK